MKVQGIQKKQVVSKQKSILELKNVTMDFGGLRAVDDVSITINNGELRGLIGPNGAGKSTIFKLIMGLYIPTSGQIYFNGKDITKLSTWERARTGMSIKMQIPGVFGELSGYENMRIAAQNFYSTSEVDKEILRLSKLVGIDDLLDTEVNNLSHGQQQWLEIGMTLASKPQLLLLDEPAAGMGPEETAFTAQIVKRLNEEGISIIFIDHDMEFVRQISQQITVLHQGRVFVEGNITEIENNKDVIDIYLGSEV
ncbi:ABC transporter ATP-binding protein [Fredinandcohnia salidurans]|uniref:ABC transporter ATP-binding protein n=1 Tax=Fredinandcohnia salidurans TaxID=2595041 RepID=A0ABW4MUM1_9BACI